jgi:outer membrane translocation and assembly module TamA
MKLSLSHDVQLSRPEQTDALLAVGFRFTSPHLALGRFVYDARLIDHYQNYRNVPVGLGGTTRLRGYQSVAVVGSHYIISNLEFRTRPVQIFSAQLAGVLFHDMGDAFNRFGEVDLLHAVGGGIRFLAPELDTSVFRIDVGTPVPFDAPRGELTIIATFGQAFGVP